MDKSVVGRDFSSIFPFDGEFVVDFLVTLTFDYIISTERRKKSTKINQFNKIKPIQTIIPLCLMVFTDFLSTLTIIPIREAIIFDLVLCGLKNRIFSSLYVD